MDDKHGLNAHAVFGDTNRAGSVPDCLVPQDLARYAPVRVPLAPVVDSMTPSP